MRAALIGALGEAPRLGDLGEPRPGPEEVLVDLVAASLNPVDLAISRGAFHRGHPPLPYVPGVEAVGRVASGDEVGRLAFAYGGGIGVSRNGTLSDHFVVPRDALIDLPEEADVKVAAALGTAGAAGWLPITWRAETGPDDVVLVLGATGTAGRVALQAARFAGAAKVIAAGRNRERLDALTSLADALVWLQDEDLAGALSRACDGAATVIYDPLFGPALEAALMVAAPAARIVQVGASAGPTATLPSSMIRGKRLNLLGYSNQGTPREVFVDAYRTMVERSIDGLLDVQVRARPIVEVERAWKELQEGSVKLVLTP